MVLVIWCGDFLFDVERGTLWSISGFNFDFSLLYDLFRIVGCFSLRPSVARNVGLLPQGPALLSFDVFSFA